MAAFLPGGKLLATGGANLPGADPVLVWDVATGVKVAQLDGPATGVESLSIFKDGKWLAAAGGDNRIYIWDVSRIRPWSK